MRRNPKLSLGKILTLRAFFERTVEAGEFDDLFVADLFAFVAEALCASWSTTPGRRPAAPCRAASGLLRLVTTQK